nr:MAG TPA: hypothetical protein [Caudoviricetes sp.]
MTANTRHDRIPFLKNSRNFLSHPKKILRRMEQQMLNLNEYSR